MVPFSIACCYVPVFASNIPLIVADTSKAVICLITTSFRLPLNFEKFYACRMVSCSVTTLSLAACLCTGVSFLYEGDFFYLMDIKVVQIK